eukprot:9313650-Pyramimonas_sp.AAC.1
MSTACWSAVGGGTVLSARSGWQRSCPTCLRTSRWILLGGRPLAPLRPAARPMGCRGGDSHWDRIPVDHSQERIRRAGGHHPSSALSPEIPA